MNNRERLLAVLDGSVPDRIPWIPRLALWYEARVRTDTMPAQWAGKSLREVEHDLNLGTPAREGAVYRKQVEGLERLTYREGPDQITELHTPIGSVREVTQYSTTLDAQGLPGRVKEYPLKSQGDYRVWEWIVEHTIWEPTYPEYEAYDREIGTDGLPMVAVGDVPFHEWLLDLAGYDHGFYQLHDLRAEVEHLLSLMTEVQRARQWPVIFSSPARFLLHGVHLSSMFTPPPLFERYILPYYEEFMPRAHAAGKAVAMHADNDTSLILDHIERAGWDMVECFVTAPMVPLTLEYAREVWGNRVSMWGGLPSTLLSPNILEEEFRDYVRALFRTIAPGAAFVLGVADNVMPDSLIERVAWVSDYVAEHGAYPLA